MQNLALNLLGVLLGSQLSLKAHVDLMTLSASLEGTINKCRYLMI